jgi:hypothetical protein
VSEDERYVTIYHQKSLPSFASFSFPFYSFNPRKTEDVGRFKIEGTVSSKYKSISFSFNLLVTNSPPYFIKKKLNSLNITLSET